VSDSTELSVKEKTFVDSGHPIVELPVTAVPVTLQTDISHISANNSH